MTTPGNEPGYAARMTDTVHDPGQDAAAQTFDGSTDVAANPLELKTGGTVRIGARLASMSSSGGDDAGLGGRRARSDRASVPIRY